MKRVITAVACVSLFVSCAATKSPESAPDPVRRQEIINSLPDLAPMEGNGGLIYSGDTAIVVQAPKGWTCVCPSGLKEGGRADLYPQGETRSGAHPTMYADVTSPLGGEGLEAFIARDIARLKSKSPSLTVKAGDKIRTTSGKKALVRLYFADEAGRCGARAYVKHGGHVALFGLDCLTRHDFGESISSFREMVSNSLIGEMKFKDKEKNR